MQDAACLIPRYPMHGHTGIPSGRLEYRFIGFGWGAVDDSRCGLFDRLRLLGQLLSAYKRVCARMMAQHPSRIRVEDVTDLGGKVVQQAIMSGLRIIVDFE